MVFTVQERFDYAVNFVLLHEGGYTDNPNDPGGPTKFGITERELKRVFTRLNLPPNVKDLTTDDAKKYYKTEWWDKFHYEAINSISVSAKILNVAVNIGAQMTHKIVQNSLNFLGYHLKEDGILGGKTIGAINEICLHGREEDLMLEICDNQACYYECLVEESPQLSVFLKGWLKRASWEGQ